MDTKGRCSRNCTSLGLLIQTSSCPKQRGKSNYLQFFAIKLLRAISIALSSVFINHISLSFSYKFEKFGQFLCIIWNIRLRSSSYLAQFNKKWHSSSTLPESHFVQILSWGRVPWYLPVSILKWWAEIRSLVKLLLCSKLCKTERYFSLPKWDLKVV